MLSVSGGGCRCCLEIGALLRACLLKLHLCLLLADAKCAVPLPPTDAADCAALVPAAQHPWKRHLQVLLSTLKKPNDAPLL